MSAAYSFGLSVGAWIKQAAGVAAQNQQPADNAYTYDVAHGRETLQHYYPKRYKPEMTDREVYELSLKLGKPAPPRRVMGGASRYGGSRQLPTKLTPYQTAMQQRYPDMSRGVVFGGNLPQAAAAPQPAPAPAPAIDENDPNTWPPVPPNTQPQRNQVAAPKPPAPQFKPMGGTNPVASSGPMAPPARQPGAATGSPRPRAPITRPPTPSL